jgi:hypothetical protein
MNINDVVKIQGSFDLRSKGNGVGKNAGKDIGKDVLKKVEFNVINELMGGKFDYKKGKKGKNSKNETEKSPLTTTQTNPAYNLSLSKSPPPDWTYIPTKSEPAMSEAEFEEAIKGLALEYAERATEIGNSGKSKSMINKEIYNLNREFELKEGKLRTLFISVVSPNRKAAYDKSDGYIVNGNEQNYWGESRLMDCGPNSWAWYPTSAEMERISKFGGIYINTLREYEAEYGKLPITTISKMWIQ